MLHELFIMHLLGCDTLLDLLQIEGKRLTDLTKVVVLFGTDFCLHAVLFRLQLHM